MPELSACPDRLYLQQFLLGQLADADSHLLEDHLVDCQSCVEILRRAHTDDSLLAALRGQPEPEPKCAADPVAGLIDQLLGAAPSNGGTVANESTAGRGEPAAERTQEVFDFLAPPQSADEIGRLGPYRVLKVLGIGGMGVVFEAEDPQLGRSVALKVPRPRLGDGASARRRFRTEARACAALTHENVISILHIGEDRGVPFLVMPLLRGETLEDRLRHDALLPSDDVMRIGRDVAAGLAVAHAAGLVHRDIKPSNVWLEADSGRAIMLDFGLARLTRDTGGTHSGTVIGTPAYMAPEQARGEQPDARCDLFSLGCVLFRAATGVAPFQGSDVLSTLRALEMEKPSAPRSLVSAIPAVLSEMILGLLEKRQVDRVGSAVEVRDALDAILAGRPPRFRRHRHRRVTAGLVVLLVVIGVGVATAFSFRGGAPHSEPLPALPVVGLPGTFWPQVSYSVGKRPYIAAVGDLDGDGKPDLAVSNIADNTVSILLNAGDGTFRPAVHYPTGSEPHGVVIGDFNRDGKPDLAVANLKSDTITLLLGNGGGTFRPGATFPCGSTPRGLATADLNGDGILDLVATNSAESTISVILGAGDGTFGPPRPYLAGGAPVSAIAADLDGDGKPDLVVSNGGNNSLSILLGNGDGTFQPPTTYGVGSGPGAVVAADFDRDGKLDLAVENVGSNDVSILLGNGDGTFQPAVSYGVGGGPGGLAAADMNGDGLIDLIVANHHTNNISYLVGKGDGTFRPAAHHAARWMPASIAIADFDGDGRPDVAVVNHLSHDLSLLRGRPPSPYFRIATNIQASTSEFMYFSVYAIDGSDNAEPTSTWKASIRSSDSRCDVPEFVSFSDKSNEVGSFRIRFRTAGIHTLTLTDVANPARLGTTSILVHPGETTRFRIEGPERVVAGKPFTVKVIAIDEFDNQTPEYGGLAKFSCTDGRALLPPEYRFIAADEGIHKFELTLASTGMQTLTVSEPTRRDPVGRTTVMVNSAGQP